MRGNAAGEYVKLKFKLGSGYKIYVNDTEVTSVREGDYLVATVPFGEFVAEAKKS